MIIDLDNCFASCCECWEAALGQMHCSSSINYPSSFISHPLASYSTITTVLPCLSRTGLLAQEFPLSYSVTFVAIVFIVGASSSIGVGGDSTHFQPSFTFSVDGMLLFLYG